MMKRSVMLMIVGIMGVLVNNLFQPLPAQSEIEMPRDKVWGDIVLNSQYDNPPPIDKHFNKFGTYSGTLQAEQFHFPSDPPNNYFQTYDYKVIVNCKYTNSTISRAPITYLLAQGTAVNFWRAQWGANATFRYFIRAEKNNPDYPDIMVPLMVSYRAKAQASQYAEASVSIVLSDFAPPDTLTNLKFLVILRAYNETLEQPPNVYIFARPAGMVCAIDLSFGIMSNHSNADPTPYNASALAFIDPEISVDPTVMIDYNGTLMSAADMYSIKYNPTMRPVGPIPSGVPLLLLSE